MSSLNYVLMRGGTSKGVFLRAQDLPMHDRLALTRILSDLFGSPDRRQIDGLGGADKLTSKAAIIGPPSVPQADVDYLFGQVGIDDAEVDYSINCGNLSAAVGMYAIQEGFVKPREGSTLVRIFNVNTQKIVHAEVPVLDGEPEWRGNFHIDGVQGTGAPIALDFSRAVGALTGRLTPLGQAGGNLHVEGLGSVELTVVDGANLVVCVAAAQLGLVGTELPAELDAVAGLRQRLDAIRKAVAYQVGLASYWDAAAAPATPILVLTSPPASHRLFASGETLHADAVDLVCRQFPGGAFTKTVGATVAATIGMAARLPGSVVARVLSPQAAAREELRLGHPGGIIQVLSAVDAISGDVSRALIYRTARRISEGKVFLRGDHWRPCPTEPCPGVPAA
jgi:2-methylaconitate cis-trans-isomerase PrpF